MKYSLKHQLLSESTQVIDKLAPRFTIDRVEDIHHAISLADGFGLIDPKTNTYDLYTLSTRGVDTLEHRWEFQPDPALFNAIQKQEAMLFLQPDSRIEIKFDRPTRGFVSIRLPEEKQQ
tara:strand:- start:487 stop:843 length:357 start_codon:yes stop_codon:yes gene_type:complete